MVCVDVQGEADITFPGNKKIKGKPGDSLKALAAKAKANINYGCEEGTSSKRSDLSAPQQRCGHAMKRTDYS